MWPGASIILRGFELILPPSLLPNCVALFQRASSLTGEPLEILEVFLQKEIFFDSTLFPVYNYISSFPNERSSLHKETNGDAKLNERLVQRGEGTICPESGLQFQACLLFHGPIFISLWPLV